MHRVFRNPIKFLVMFNRVKNYIGIVQFVMIGYLFIVSTEFDLVLTLILVSAFSITLGAIDYKLILPHEQKNVSEKNPVFMDILKKLERIEKNKCITSK